MVEEKRTATRLRREDRIAEIIAASREVITQNNGVEMPVNEIAARLGIVEGAIYRVFPTKKHLTTAVLSDWYVEVMATYEAGLAGIVGTREQLHFVARHHIDCIHRYPELVNFYFGVVRMSRDYWGSELNRLNARYANRVIKIIGEAAARGELRQDISPRLGRDMLFGVVEQATWPFRMKVGTFDPEGLASNIAELIYQAYALPPDRSLRQESLSSRLLAISAELRGLAGGGEA